MMSVKREKDDRRACLKKSGIKASEGKRVYISRETRYRISMIVRPPGNGGITIADFTENVAGECLCTHRGELNRMLDAVLKVELWA